MSWLSKAFNGAKDIVHKVDPIAKYTDEKVVEPVLGGAYSKLKNFSDFEKSKLSDVWGQLKSHPQRILYGSFDPLTTKMWNKILGTDYDPVINQLGGPTEQNYDNAKKRGVEGTGSTRTMHDVVGTIAGLWGGHGLANVVGKGASALASKAGSGALEAGSTAGADTVGTVGDVGGGALESSASPLQEIVVNGTRVGGTGAGEALGEGAGALASTAAEDGSLIDDTGHQTPPHDAGTGDPANMQGYLDKYGTNAWDYAKDPQHWGTIAKAGGALGSLFKGSGDSPPNPSIDSGYQVDPSDFSRNFKGYGDDYYTYGSRPEYSFYDQNSVGSSGGSQKGTQPWMGDQTSPGGFAHGNLVKGPGSGREDKIPAVLSDGEYVMDAETVALLGDGSTDEGAKRLDQLRTKLRQHKGRELSKGKFSSQAKAPEEYLGED